MTTAAASDQAGLSWPDLAPLHALLIVDERPWDPAATLSRGLRPPAGERSSAAGPTRVAAAEAAARLPLTATAWERIGSVLIDLLDARDASVPLRPVARTAAHAPLLSVRRRLRAVAGDGAHPGQHLASVALAEVGDGGVLAGEVSRLLSRPLTDRTALRLAGLPLECLRTAPVLPVEETTTPVSAWWTAVAAARLGDAGPLDNLLDRLRADPAALPPAVLRSLLAVLPLPDDLRARLHQRLAAGSPGHDVLRAAWLTSPSLPPEAQRLDDFAGPLRSFVADVQRGSVIQAGLRLAADAAAVPHGSAPDPANVYDTWLRLTDRAKPAWPAVAWTLGRAGSGRLLGRLSGWLDDPASAVAACHAVRDAAAWSTAATFPVAESLVPATPPWVRPSELVDHRLSPPIETGAPPSPPAAADPWAAPDVSFDVGFEPEGVDLDAETEPAEPEPPRRGLEPAARDPVRGLEPLPEPPAAGDRPKPSTLAYARMSCPSVVVVDEEFELELGLASRPTPGVTAQPLTLPDRPNYTLTVQVIVDGFRLRAGEQPTIELAVSADTPFPTETLHLSAVAGPELGPLRSILAVYSVDGVTVGSATRAVEVVPRPADLPADARTAPATGIDTSLPVAAQAADLTITISMGDDIEGRRLLWSFQSPHSSVPGSAEPVACSLGSRPDEFARALMKAAGRSQGELLRRLITGKARQIGEVVPAEVRAALRATATAVGGAPTVLLLSADPYVPWELADVGSPWLADAPAMLGAQAVVGRWALRSPGPTREPPRSVSMQAMTVVRGIYEGVIGFRRLEHAEQEAADLATAYGAELVDAAEQPFFACLDGTPSAEVLHFAMHGKFDPTGLQDGLILVDGVVEPDMILGADLTRHPFVFLNACQVGQAGETLGRYGGMAQAFVEAGASAVIAPLWVVKDDVARDVSLRFYDSVFSGTSPAEFLRAERARDGSGTHLAYVLYGHPLLQLTRSKEAGDGHPAGP